MLTAKRLPDASLLQSAPYAIPLPRTLARERGGRFASLLHRSVWQGHDRRDVQFGARGGCTTLRHRHPGNTDVAAEEGLAGHAVASLELLFGQMLALFGLDGVGVLQALLDPAFAGAADS